MHPLMWTLLLSFSLICLLISIAILFFSFTKPNNTAHENSSSSKMESKNLTWKW